MKRRKFIRYTKERVVLSDVLPYEVPITFSNRYFYKFLVDNRIELKSHTLIFKNRFRNRESDAFLEMLKIITGSSDVHPSHINLHRDALKKIPFKYKVLHKDSDFRTLTLMHPFSQISIVDFYEQYKELILYHSRLSQFSIRKPDSIARFVFFNDKLHADSLGNKDDYIELTGKEYENLKTFFTYKKYVNIFRFYEDYRYQRAEKKFKMLSKFDINKCFDSIYTHSIAWAILNKNIVKYNIAKSKDTFAGRFDRLLQNLNFGETNGIVIGPEVSRIFAELILQTIDANVERLLKNGDKKLRNRVDYEVYRYVDDYFIFCDESSVRDTIIKTFKHELNEYLLSLNVNKEKEYTRPMVTEITVAKQKINKLLEDSPIFKVRKRDTTIVDELFEQKHVIDIKDYKFSFYINSNKLATQFKSILKESGASYRDVLNYTFSVLNNKIQYVIESFETKFSEYSQAHSSKSLDDAEVVKKKKLENRFSEFIVGYLDFIFFLYSVSPRVNTTVKLSHILSRIIKYFKGAYSNGGYRFSEINRDNVFKKISDDIALILTKNEIDRNAQVEVLYLFVVLKELGKNYRLNKKVLAKHFSIYDQSSGAIRIVHLNYFCITSLLFYIGRIQQYEEIRAAIEDFVVDSFASVDANRRSDSSEKVILLLDLIVCPWLSRDYKKKLLNLFSVREDLWDDVIDFKCRQKYWFTKWENFNLLKELNFKSSEEVYS